MVPHLISKNLSVSLIICLCVAKLACFAFPSAAFAASAGDNPLSEKIHTKALNAEKAGNLRMALELEQQASRQSPTNITYRGELARLLWEVGFIDRGMQECREALKLAPDNLKCRFNLAVMLQLFGDPKASIAEYEKVLKKAPGNLQARLGYMQALSLAGKMQEAVDQIDLLKTQGKGDPALMIEVADAAIKIDQPRRAKEILRDFAGSTTTRALTLLYVAAAKDGDNKLARSIQKKVLDSGSKDSRVYSIAAKLADGSDGFQQMEQILEKAMKSVNSDGELYIQLAGIFTRQSLQSRLSSNEKNAQAWLGLADKALTFAESIHSKAWRYRFAHAGVFDLQGKRKDAIAVIDQLAKQEPKNELINYCRKRLRAYENNPAAAAKRGIKNLLGDGSGSLDDSAQALNVACSRAYFDKFGCGCHTAVLELKWKRSGGVLYAKVVSEQPAVALIVHELGDANGYKGRIISVAASTNEHVTKVESEAVKGLGALSMNVAAPEEQAEAPLMSRLNPPGLQRL